MLNALIYILIIISLVGPPTKADFTVSDSMPACKGFTISNSDSTQIKFGYAVDGGGDLNGDGIPDLVITGYNEPNPTSVYVVYGQSNGYTNIDVNTMTSQQGFKITGFGITNIDNSNFVTLDGDIDGDGLADLVIGAVTQDAGVSAGYVIYGKQGGYNNFDVSSLPLTAVKITGAAGWNVNTRGDINGDGLNDLVLTSSGADATFGAVFVIFGSATRLTSFNIASLALPVGFKISGFNSAYIGAAFASAGDFDGDGIDDFTFSAPGAMTDQGVAYVIYGKSTPNWADFSVSTTTDAGRLTVTGTSSIFKLCLVASNAGDFNNDGYSDVIWASPPTNSNQGHVALLYGANPRPADFGITSLTSTRGLKLVGATTGDFLGSALSNLKDLSGDGITEVLVGSKGASGGGVVYVIYGRDDEPIDINVASIAEPDGFKIIGSTAGSLFGQSARDIGDINGDGVPDIAIGAPGTGATGKVYVVFGVNAWACNTCDTFKKCQTCETGYDYTWNGVCYKDCPVHAPYKLNWECFSSDPIPKPPSVIQPTLKSSVATSAVTTYATNKVMNFWSPADALPFLYGQLKTSITYMRFLNVSRSDKLEEMFLLFADSDTNVIPWVGMPDSIKDSFPQYDLPYMFSKYQVPSSFIANFGDDLTCFVIVFVLFTGVQIALTVIRKWMRNIPTVKHLLQKASITLQNFFVGAFAEALGPIIFYTTMEFKNSTTGGEAYSVLSPITCYLCVLLGLSILILNIWIVQKLQGVKKKTSPQEDNYEYKVLEKRYQGFSVLYEEFDKDSLSQQAAFLFFNLRTVVESFIIGVLFDEPMTQVILLMLINLVFLFYLAIKKPFDSKLDTIQQFSLLLVIFTCNCCFIQLAGSDDNIQNTSEIVFYLLVVFQFVPLLFFAINMIQTLLEAYHFLRTHLLAKKKSFKNTSKLDEKHYDSSSIFPFDPSCSFKTSTCEVVVSDDRLLTADPSNRPSAQKSLRVHARKKRIVPAGGGFWEAGIETIGLGNPSEDRINKADTIEKSNSLALEPRIKRLQRRESKSDAQVEEGESSNIVNPLSEIKSIQVDLKQAEPIKDNLATVESRHKRIQSDLAQLKLNSKDSSSSFEMNLGNPIVEKAEMKGPEIEPEKVSLGQIKHRLKPTKRRKNSSGVVYQ